MLKVHYEEDKEPTWYISGVYASLDGMQSRLERDGKLLDTVQEILLDYCIRNFTAMKDEEIKMPKELKVINDLVWLVKDNCATECDIIADDKKELSRLMEMFAR